MTFAAAGKKDDVVMNEEVIGSGVCGETLQGHLRGEFIGECHPIKVTLGLNSWEV